MSEGEDTFVASICSTDRGAGGWSSSGGNCLCGAGCVAVTPVANHVLAIDISCCGAPGLGKTSISGARSVSDTSVGGEGEDTGKANLGSSICHTG